MSLSMTTVFIPPPSCSSHWTYEASLYNGVSKGLLLQNALAAPLDTSCFPSGYSKYGRASMPHVYSPGVCPIGYTTPARFLNGATTTVVCCLSSFSYYTTHETFIDSIPTNSMMYAGCISTFPEASGATTVVARGTDDVLSTTVVSGPITMWGQPVEVAFQQRDLPFYTFSTSGPAPSSTASSSTTAQPSSNPILPAATAVISIDQPKTAISVLSASSGGSVSVNAGARLGFALTGTFLVAVALMLLWRRREQARVHKQRTLETLFKHRAPIKSGNINMYV